MEMKELYNFTNILFTLYMSFLKLGITLIFHFHFIKRNGCFSHFWEECYGGDRMECVFPYNHYISSHLDPFHFILFSLPKWVF